jgi:hypothetical protein
LVEVTLFLNVLTDLTGELTAEICDGETYMFHGQALTTSGQYQRTIPSSAGCDSTIYLTLIVYNTDPISLEASICQGTSYDFEGQILTQPGTYTRNIVGSGGCLIQVTLTLTVNPTYSITQNISICQGETLTWNGDNYTNTGVYQKVLKTRFFCDSLVILNLSVLPLEYSIVNAEICEGDAYIFNGNAYNQPGTYVDTLVGSNGCPRYENSQFDGKSSILQYFKSANL